VQKGLNVQSPVNPGRALVGAAGRRAAVTGPPDTAVDHGDDRRGLENIVHLIPTGVRGRAAKILATAMLPIAIIGFAGSRVAVASDGVGGGHVSWLSGFGDDANPCSRTAPCKTLMGAFSKTSQPGGEIDAIDPGSYGQPNNYLTEPTIDGGIVVNGSPGFITLQTSVAGLDGLDIAAEPNDVVVLRHVDLQGFGIGLHGINFISGKALYIEDSVIEGFTGDGVHVAPTAGGTVVVDNTSIRNNGQNGVNATGGSSTAPARVTVKNSRVQGNGAAGVLAADDSDVTVDGSTVTGDAPGLACVTQSTGNCVMTASDNVVAQNTAGVLSGRGVPGATGKATVYITGNTITGNAKGLSVTALPSFGRIISLGDNSVVDNNVVGKPTSTVAKL
jgi:hypothetical protein